MTPGGYDVAPCPINYAWWAESNDTSLNFLAPREPSETPLPAGHREFYAIKIINEKNDEYFV